MELGIKGHETRGDEVIKILETLGGVNRYNVTGCLNKYFYYISKNYKDIESTYIGPDEIKGYEIFSLDEFTEKFPYKVGDKVKVWINYDYFGGRAELEDAEIKSMRWNSARCEIAYKMKDITREFYKDDIKGKVDDDEEQQIDTTIDYTEIDKQCFDEVEKRYSEITHVFLTGRGYTLPYGFHLVDENGKAIDASKIKLVKNSPYYPKSYDECCDVLKIPNDERYIDIDVPLDYNKLLDAFTELLICRDAYWKIAGEQMGLDKPWKPVWDESEDLYTIHTFNGEIRLSGTSHRNAILVFPTEEMREAFYENFKDLIEQCKELL